MSLNRSISSGVGVVFYLKQKMSLLTACLLHVQHKEDQSLAGTLMPILEGEVLNAKELH